MLAWLEERRGGLEPPNAAECECFGAIAKEGEITQDMFVTHQSSSLPGAIEGMREVWTAVVAEVKDKLREAGAQPPSAIRAQKIIAWCVIPSRIWQELPLSLLADAADVLKSGRVAAVPEEASTKRSVIPAPEGLPPALSPEQKEDMESQGASRPEQLQQLYVSCQLGRKAGSAECEGMGYMSHWSMAKGMKQISKNPTGLGYKNLPQLLEAAKLDGNLLQLDKFMQRTAEIFMLDASDIFWTRGGSRLITRWSRAKSICPSDGRVAAWYFSLFWEDQPGRGMPDLKVDYDLIRDAERAVKGLEQVNRPGIACEQAPWSGLRRPASDAGSVSSLGSAMSEANTEKMLEGFSRTMMGAFETKFGELKSEMDKRHSDVLSRFGRGGVKAEEDTKPATRGRCFACNRRGHTVTECTELIKWKAHAKAVGDVPKDDE